MHLSAHYTGGFAVIHWQHITNMKKTRINETFEVAKYLLALDNSFFTSNKKVEIRRKETSLGRLRLNKYLHIISAVYAKQNDEPLCTNDRKWKALANGGVFVSPDKLMRFAKENKSLEDNLLEDKIKKIVFKIYHELSFYNIEQIVEISHKDENWIKAWNNSKKKNADEFSDEFSFG